MLNTLHLRDIHKNRKLKICGIIQAQVQKIFISESGYIHIKIHIFKISKEKKHLSKYLSTPHEVVKIL